MFALGLLLGCGPSEPEVLLIDAEVVWTPGPACPRPEARAALGPYQLHRNGDDWSHAPVAGSVTEAGWGLVTLDAEGDGLPEVFLPTFGQDRLYTRLGDGRWVDVSDRLPPGDTASLGGAAADVDGDGDTDLVVTRRGPNQLLLNEGGRFVPGPPLSDLPAESQHASFGDLDGDGLPELFIANFLRDDLVTEGDPNELYVNLGGGRLRDHSDALQPVEASRGPTNAGGFTDIDADGDLDLFIVNDKPDDGYVTMWMVNDGAGGLSWDHGASGLAIATKGMGLGVGELNGDGLPELVVTGWAELPLMISAPDGTWYDASRAWGLLPDPERVVGWGVELADLDNDGDDDVVVAYGANFDMTGARPEPGINPEHQPMGIYLNEGGHFREVSAEWGLDQPGNHRGFILEDLDHDGYLDLLVRDLVGPPRMHLSRCGEAAWLTVALDGPGANTRALGARVWVQAGERSWWRAVHAGATNISSSGRPVVHFGLGELDRVDRVEVHWPDGARSVLEDVPTRAHLRLTHEAASLGLR